MNLFFYLLAVLLFPALHVVNEKLFFFAVFNSQISWIYLPAFSRLFNVLIFGALPGSAITFLGGLLLFPFVGEHSWLFVANDACSALGPLIALGIFRILNDGPVSLRNLKHLTYLTLIYTLSNSLIHHLAWTFFDENLLVNGLQFFEMLVGDLVGTFVGVLLLKIITDLSFFKRRIYNNSPD